MADGGDHVRYSLEPGVLVLADSDEDRAAAAALVEGGGGRVLAARAIEGAIEWLDQQPGLDAVMLAVRDDPGPLLDRLLARLDLAARERRHASVVSIPRALADLALAAAPHEDVILLCEADAMERAAALGLALARSQPVSPRVHDRDPEPVRLRQLSEEVGRIARTLATLSGMEDGAGPIPGLLVHPRPDPAAPGMPSAAGLRAVIRARRLRDQYFDTALFADPAWDMLLDLMAARLEGRRVAVSSLCIAAAVPPTTALRWIKQLTDRGLFVRVADPRDGRRVFIELADRAADAIAAYFQALARTGLASA